MVFKHIIGIRFSCWLRICWFRCSKPSITGAGLIHDNHKKHRILVFASPTGLKMLAETENGMLLVHFTPKSRYFGRRC
jgi:hypothetical protein